MARSRTTAAKLGRRKKPGQRARSRPPPHGSAVRLRDMSANTVHRCACVQPSVGTSCLQLVCVSGGSKPRLSCAHYPPPRGALLPSQAGYVRSPSTPPPHHPIFKKSRGRLPGFTDERDPWKPHSERGGDNTGTDRCAAVRQCVQVREAPSVHREFAVEVSLDAGWPNIRNSRLRPTCGPR
jgi:hypothetical protein